MAFSGHIQTTEHIRPGELYEGWVNPAGALGDRSPGAAPFPQFVVGASGGSWWSGDFNDESIPMSYQRFVAPRGYLIVEFNRNIYTAQYKASGKPIEKQISLSILSPTFTEWANTMMDWFKIDPYTLETPPVNVNDRLDTKIVEKDEISKIPTSWPTSGMFPRILRYMCGSTIVLQS
ncbi:MAG: calcineurin-like phosphoesterase C-terminal domain-containing protein [Thermodesulfobacteriota bacterium]|nr:calcineurin-like phosphoesterase C-terminal domain-containing protein [Thermodesulfobacteriota bacterium]